MSNEPSRLGRGRSALLVAACACLWSIAGVLTRQLERADGFEITFWRSFFCVLFMIGALAWQTRGNPFRPVLAMGTAGMVSGVMWSIMFTCFMLALTRTSTANTLLVLSLAPLLTALLAAAVLREHLSAGTWVAIVAAGAGIGWMVHEGVSSEGLTGMAIALAVPFASAINFVTLRRMHAKVDLAPAVLTGGLLSCLATLPLALPFDATSHDLLILALLGSVQLGLPCMVLMRAASQLPPHQVALLSLLEVVLGPVWAWLGAGEAIGAATVQGGLIVLAALIGNELLGARRNMAISTA